MVLRVVEFACIPHASFEGAESTANFGFQVLRSEAVAVGWHLVSFGLIAAFVSAFAPRVGRVLQAFFFFLVFLIFLATTQFFYTTHLLLDKVLFHFRLSELVEIVGSESETTTSEFLWFHLWGVAALISFTYLGLHGTPLLKNRRWIAAVIVLYFGLIASVWIYPAEHAMSASSEKVAMSKTGYFLGSVYESLWPRHKPVGDFDNAVARYRKLNHLPQIALQTEYPLISVWSGSKSRLAPYFEEFDTAPNVVLVFCEGLSSSFSGPGAYYGDMTPHLSALYESGLYWPNALSNTNRTHGAFSNALASMPHAFERGPLNLKTEKYPEHLSLPKVLGSNGYDAAFLYGGWAYFDNYEPFLRMNYVDKIYGEKFLRDNYTSTGLIGPERHAWGISDKPFFNLYFELGEDDRLQPPYLGVFLNQDLHSPYEVPEHEKYLAMAHERFSEVNGNMELFERNADKFATILYMDEAIGEFMAAYRTRSDYEQTIFVFVGDHNFFGLPMINDLDAHHVPLVIYSPKIKKAERFRDVVAHTDIPPALIKLLEPHLDQHKMPTFSNWMSSGLSTTDQLRAAHPIFLGQFNGDIYGVVRNDSVYLENRLYALKPHLRLEPARDDETEESYSRLLDDYRMINRYVFDNDKLLLDPDSVYLNHRAAFYFPE